MQFFYKWDFIIMLPIVYSGSALYRGDRGREGAEGGSYKEQQQPAKKD